MTLGGGLSLIAAFAAAVQSPGDAEIPAVTFPALPAQAPTIQAFMPASWRLESEVTGDLNRDKLPDRAFVLRMTDPRNRIKSDWGEPYDSNPRMLAVAFALPGGGYGLAVVDQRLIPRLENQNQDDPFDDIAIVNGALRVRMHLFMSAGGWEMGGTAYTFRWQDGAFRLIGFDRDIVRRNSGETREISINYLTGRKQLKTGNIGTDRQSSRTVRIARKPLLELGQIGDGLMFDPEER